MAQLFKKAAVWMWTRAWPYAEIASADDARFRTAFGANKGDINLLEAFHTFTGRNLGPDDDLDAVFEAINAVVSENDERRVERLAQEAKTGKPKDVWVHLFERLHQDQNTLKAITNASTPAAAQTLLDKEQQLVARLQANVQSGEVLTSPLVANRLRDLQEKVMNLLAAYNRDAETDLHRSLSNVDTKAGKYISDTVNFCVQQRDRVVQGVRKTPWGRGIRMSWLEWLCIIVTILGIIAINGFTEVMTYGFGEYVGVARNGVARPRSFWQLFIALFIFPCTDGWSLWELGRQRSLGAMLSFCLYAYAYFHREIYGQLHFVIGTAVGAVIFQTMVQLGDLAWISFKLFRIRREVYDSYSLGRFISCWVRWKLPRWTGLHRDFPAAGTMAANRAIYDNLKMFNARSTAWAKGFTKSKAMSITWTIYARNRATPRNIYAVCGNVTVKLVFSADFWKKQSLVLFTLAVWGFSDYATWQRWLIFTIITAFFGATSAKLQELAAAPEQEVQSSFNVFCNMVGANIPTLCFVLSLAARHPEWFIRPNILAWLMPFVFVVSLWTDVYSAGLMNGPGWIRRQFRKLVAKVRRALAQ